MFLPNVELYSNVVKQYPSRKLFHHALISVSHFLVLILSLQNELMKETSTTKLNANLNYLYNKLASNENFFFTKLINLQQKKLFTPISLYW